MRSKKSGHRVLRVVGRVVHSTRDVGRVQVGGRQSLSLCGVRGGQPERLEASRESRDCDGW